MTPIDVLAKAGRPMTAVEIAAALRCTKAEIYPHLVRAEGDGMVRVIVNHLQDSDTKAKRAECTWHMAPGVLQPRRAWVGA